MEKYGYIVGLILFLGGVIVLSFTSTSDYIRFVNGRQNYKICNVRIVEKQGGPKENKTAYFYYDMNGNQCKGSVFCNFWEEQGDIIEVAYSADYNFLRTIIKIGDSDMRIVIFCSVFIVYSIWKGFQLIYKKISKN